MGSGFSAVPHSVGRGSLSEEGAFSGRGLLCPPFLGHMVSSRMGGSSSSKEGLILLFLYRWVTVWGSPY